jgi:hypothetical protein
MPEATIERGSCRFVATSKPNTKTTITLDFYHDTVPALAGCQMSFELLNGTTSEQARALADALNERVLGVVVARSGPHSK